MSVNDKLNRIKEIKGNIKDAIVEKGVEVTDSDSFNSYADKIREISGGSEPEKPVVPQTPWVKPEGWPDIKEGMKDNQIRLLICDKASRNDINLYMHGSHTPQGLKLDCTIDWGDGSEPEIITEVGDARFSHVFNADNSIKYTDEYGITHNMYIVTIDCRDVSVVQGIDTHDKNMILWYVDSCTQEYSGEDRRLNFQSHLNLQCAECIGGKDINSIFFENCPSLREFKCIGRVKLSGGFSGMFSECKSLTSLDVSNWDTSNLTSMNTMFIGCKSLTSLDVSNWDTSNVTSMNSMFNNCNSLTSLDVSNWDTSNVTDMSTMFSECKSLTSLDVSNWDTSNVTDMQNMFSGCESLTSLDVSNWDTSNVTSTGRMFYNCNSLTSLDVSNWDTSNVMEMITMFYNCNSLTSLDVSNWDTSNLTDMQSIFYGCKSLTSLDVSNWDMSNVTNVSSMFNACNSLEEIKPSKWDFSSFTGSSSSSKCKTIFSNCSKLKKVDITLQNSVDITSSSYLPINTTSSTYTMSFHDFSLCIPRASFKVKIKMSESYLTNINLQRLKITGQDGMKFTASSPQIELDNTYAFKEEQINEFFTNLPTVTNSPTISLKGNPHAGYANMGIALEKGWNVLYDSSTNSTSTIPLGDEENAPILPLAYRFIPEEDGTFVDANGNKCNLLYSQSVATMNPTGWEMLPTFEDALNKYGIEVEEEYREEIAKDVLAYANDDSLIKRYNIELD